MVEVDRRRFALGIACGAAALGLGSRTMAAAGRPGIVTYRDPSCGCCHKWADAARKAGYAVTVRETPDIAALKTGLHVPPALASCHTSVVAGYVLEGHVPLAAVAALLRARPKSITGLAVPGMPRGSPGMEMPDGSRDPYKVIAFNRAGQQRIFMSVPLVQ